jgi:hypothetical protein
MLLSLILIEIDRYDFVLIELVELVLEFADRRCAMIDLRLKVAHLLYSVCLSLLPLRSFIERICILDELEDVRLTRLGRMNGE